jgi:hypothetical protein
MELFAGMNIDDLEQVAQIVYNDCLLDIFRDSNMIYVIYQNRLTQVSFTETILETLHNVFENNLVFEIDNLLFFKEKGTGTEAADYEKANLFNSTWSSHLTPFQLLLN